MSNWLTWFDFCRFDSLDVFIDCVGIGGPCTLKVVIDITFIIEVVICKFHDT